MAGGRGPGASGGQEDERPLRTYIDASGNIVAAAPSVAPVSQAPRDVEMYSRATQDPETGYRGMHEGDQQEQPQQNQWWHLRTCFPAFRWNSVLGYIVFVQLLTYLASCWLVTPRKAAEPDGVALWKIGSSNWEAERCASAVGGKYILELRRLVVPIFLHASVMHIIMNLYFELVSGQRALEKYGAARFLLLFFSAGVGGNLLSDARETNGVGASTSCYGLIGANMAQVWLVWNLPGREEWREHMKKALMQQAGMLLLWEVINWKTIDHYGHLGGLLSGFAVAVILARPSLDGAEPSTPPDLRRRALLCGAALCVGVSYCVVKIFFWQVFFWAAKNDKGELVHSEMGTDGKMHDFTWKDICQARVSGTYSRS